MGIGTTGHTIGVLTAGGDSPGINAFLRALYYVGRKNGVRVCAIKRGWEGILSNDFSELTEEDVKNIAFTGGSILKNSKTNPLKDESFPKIAADFAKRHKLEAFVVCGSFDTYRIAAELDKAGVPVICVPQTIDNDISGTDCTLGFYSSVKNIVSAIDTIRTTNESHERDVIIEIMGREAGWLTVFSALSTKVEGFLIPEMGTVSVSRIVELLKSQKANGRTDNIILVSEGVSIEGVDRNVTDGMIYSDIDLSGISFKLADLISAAGCPKPKVVILSYIQRGGVPDLYDVLLGVRYANIAIECVRSQKYGVAAGLRENRMLTYPIAEAIREYKLVSTYYIELAADLLDE